jgi:hypothetical protein
MKFIKFVFLLYILIFVFSTKIAVGQVYYTVDPDVDCPYENDIKQIKKIILVDPNPLVTFSGHRGSRVSLKRIARVERRVKRIIKKPIIRIIGKVIPIINYQPDTIARIRLQEFVKKLTRDLDSVDNQLNFFKMNKISCPIPLAIDSNKETNFILLTHYHGKIVTQTGGTKHRNRNLGTLYILLINKKNSTVYYFNEINLSPLVGNLSLYCRVLRKLKKDLKNGH